MKWVILFIGFLLGSLAIGIQSALSFKISLFAYAPTLAIVCLYTRPPLSLWFAAIIGLIMDLFSSDPSGIYALTTTLCIIVMQSKRILIFKEFIFQLCFLTFLISLTIHLFHFFILFLLDHQIPIQEKSDYLHICFSPFIDMIYAFLWFAGPIMLIEWAGSEWKRWRIQKNATE